MTIACAEHRVLLMAGPDKPLTSVDFSIKPVHP
jgi:hypothetical protein